MDRYTTDRQALKSKKCPDCGTAIYTYMPHEKKEHRHPVCKVCDQWFERVMNDSYIRCSGAADEYKRRWEEFLKQAKREVATK